MRMTTSVVGRQPIVDRRMSLIGYELLFRSVADSSSAFIDLTEPQLSAPDLGDAMSTTVFFNTLDIGIHRTVGDKLMFCNADRGVLTGSVSITLPPEQTVIEVLETVAADSAVLRGCQRLSEAGYRLAADDFEWFPGAEKLIDLVDIVKIDVQATAPGDVVDIVTRCRDHDVQVLAEKVETDAELDRCMELGFDLFQGYLLGRPDTVASRSVAASHVGILRLTNSLMCGNVDFDRLEDILRADPALAYRLLQVASIGRLGEFKRPIRSLREALVTVGVDRMRGWLPALLLRPAGTAIDSALPGVLSRARAAELLAYRLHPTQSGFAFAAGMLSAFDLLLGVNRQELPDLLHVPDDLRAAAFDGRGEIGHLVDTVLAYERDREIPDLSGVDMDTMDRVAAHAFSWAIQVSDGLDTVAV